MMCVRKNSSGGGRASTLVVFLAGLVGLLGGASGACSSSGNPPGTDAGTGGDADVKGDSADDAGSPALLTCQGIRLCMMAGSDVESCAARGTTEGQAAFQKLRDCLQPLCPELLFACVCRESCQQPDGYCLDEADACAAASGSTVDAVCRQYCGG
jgi:hypothetical protein